ncbi:dUTP diphosphatase [Pontibacter beigongshangensis]|uniref:dUTP diphosphatase n=1 Tax=Pontibacter beigongshangensis TaxID=2574733 RepID=UPI00164EFE09|nr:dUTP diphosphatase [Pontibacter beigongshangensis]
MKVKVKKLVERAVIPTYSKPGDAGLDLTAVDYSETDRYQEYHTGLSFEIPEGYVGLLFPRSSITKHDMLLKNSVGVIDSSFRGEVTLRFQRVSSGMNPLRKDYEVGDRIGQLIILPYPKIEFEEVQELSASERGTGGFGSTNIPFCEEAAFNPLNPNSGDAHNKETCEHCKR